MSAAAVGLERRRNFIEGSTAVVGSGFSPSLTPARTRHGPRPSRAARPRAPVRLQRPEGGYGLRAMRGGGDIRDARCRRRRRRRRHPAELLLRLPTRVVARAARSAHAHAPTPATEHDARQARAFARGYSPRSRRRTGRRAAVGPRRRRVRGRRAGGVGGRGHGGGVAAPRRGARGLHRRVRVRRRRDPRRMRLPRRHAPLLQGYRARARRWPARRVQPAPPPPSTTKLSPQQRSEQPTVARTLLHRATSRQPRVQQPAGRRGRVVLGLDVGKGRRHGPDDGSPAPRGDGWGWARMGFLLLRCCPLDVNAAPRGATTSRARRRRPCEAPATHRRASRPRRTPRVTSDGVSPQPRGAARVDRGRRRRIFAAGGLAVPGVVWRDPPRSAPVVVVSGPSDRHVDVDVRAGARDRRPG